MIDPDQLVEGVSRLRVLDVGFAGAHSVPNCVKVDDIVIYWGTHEDRLGMGRTIRVLQRDVPNTWIFPPHALEACSITERSAHDKEHKGESRDC